MRESGAVDRDRLNAIIVRHGLADKWERFAGKYLEELMTEQERRKRLASLSFSEKLKILEKLRDRSRAIAAGGLRSSTGNRTTKRNPESK